MAAPQGALVVNPDEAAVPSIPLPSGMPPRDYFAAMAMQGWLASSWNLGGFLLEPRKLATWSYKIADAMLAASTALTK
jgi:hypothetical protein